MWKIHKKGKLFYKLSNPAIKSYRCVTSRTRQPIYKSYLFGSELMQFNFSMILKEIINMKTSIVIFLLAFMLESNAQKPSNPNFAMPNCIKYAYLELGKQKSRITAKFGTNYKQFQDDETYSMCYLLNPTNELNPISVSFFYSSGDNYCESVAMYFGINQLEVIANYMDLHFKEKAPPYGSNVSFDKAWTTSNNHRTYIWKLKILDKVFFVTISEIKN